jgi:hypothetical protein
MAQEGAMEAAIAKAIEIAGPDAQAYFQNRQNNLDWANKFGLAQQGQNFTQDNLALQQRYQIELRNLEQGFASKNVDANFANTLKQNYLAAIANYESQFNSAVAAVQGSEMSADSKTAMLEQLTYMRDANISLTTNAFSQMPEWQASWSGLTTLLPTSQAPRVAPVSPTSDYSKWSDTDLADMLDYYSQPAYRKQVPAETYAKWEAEAKRRLG